MFHPFHQFLQLLRFPPRCRSACQYFCRPPKWGPAACYPAYLQRKWDQNLRRKTSKSNKDTKKNASFPALLMAATMMPRASSIPLEQSEIRKVFHVAGGWVQDEWHRVQIRTSSDILKAQTPFSPIYHQILPTTMQQILTTVEISKTFWMILESWHQALYTKAPCCSALLSYKRHLQLRQQQVVPTHRYANQTWRLQK